MRGQARSTLQVAAVVLVAALVAGGCSTNREVTRPKPVAVTEARLKATLVTDKDLPDTFSPATPSTPINAELIPEHKCDDALKQLKPKAEASADFTASGVRFSNTVAWFPGQGGAVDQLYHDIATACAAVVVTSKNVSLRTSSLDFGVLSKDTFPLKIDVEKPDGTIEERDLIVVRLGDLVDTIRLTGLRPSDKVLLDATARIAIGRLGLLADETAG